MKKLLFGLLLVLSIIAAGCNKQPSVEEATATFCQNLAAFGESVKSLEAITPRSTVGDLQDATKAVDDAWNQVTKSAQQLREVKLDDIDEAWKNVRKTANDVSNSDTLAATATNIAVGLEGVKVAYNAVGQVTCPEIGTLGPAAPTAADTLTAEPAPTEPAPVGFTGAYSVTLSLAGDVNSEMVLVLNEDKSAFLVTRLVGDPNEIVVSGLWQDNNDGTATTTLSDLIDGTQLATPEMLTFRLDGSNLAAIDFDQTVYGPEGFTMTRLPGAAIAAEISTLAPQAGAAVTGTAPVTSTVPLTTAEEAPLLPDLSAAAEAPAAPPAVEETGAPQAALLGTWQLQRIDQTSSVSYTPDDPSLYTVTFNPGGTLGVVADCNTGGGTYQASDNGMLSLQLATTRAYCATGSLSNQFISYLGVANSYSVAGDQLTIGFSSNNGFMYFTPAP